MRDTDALANVAKVKLAIKPNDGSHYGDSDFSGDVILLSHNAEATAARHFVDAVNVANQAKHDMSLACVAMAKESQRVVDEAKKAVSQINDAAGKMAQSLAKTKEIMGPQVESRLSQLERFIDCMDRLQKLESDGTLDRVASVLKR